MDRVDDDYSKWLNEDDMPGKVIDPLYMVCQKCDHEGLETFIVGVGRVTGLDVALGARDGFRMRIRAVCPVCGHYQNYRVFAFETITQETARIIRKEKRGTGF